MVVKHDGRREEFSRQKLMGGLLRAAQKRPDPGQPAGGIVEAAEGMLHRREEREIATPRSAPSSWTAARDRPGRLRALRLGLPALRRHRRLHGRAQEPPTARAAARRRVAAMRGRRLPPILMVSQLRRDLDRRCSRSWRRRPDDAHGAARGAGESTWWRPRGGGGPAEVPGLTAADLEITIEGRRSRIAGRRRLKLPARRAIRFHCVERRMGKFARRHQDAGRLRPRGTAGRAGDHPAAGRGASARRLEIEESTESEEGGDGRSRSLTSCPVLPLKDTVVFPYIILPLSVRATRASWPWTGRSPRTA
jgi:hypothetical protein